MEYHSLRNKPTYSGLHPAKLNYNLSAKTKLFSRKYERRTLHEHEPGCQRPRQLAENTADSLQNALTNLQEGIDGLALPMVGGLTGKTGGGLESSSQLKQ